jgi:hypothetical protein
MTMTTMIPPRSDLRWIGVDLDGTLAEPIWTPANPTREIGKPIWPNWVKLQEARNLGYKMVIHTSRPWTDHEIIETWLDRCDLAYLIHSIQCGKPLFALYIDDRGRHESAESWLP